MTIKSTIALCFHRSVIILYCIAFIIVLMFSTAHFIKRQQSEQLAQSQALTHSLIKQIALPLVPLINKYSNNDDNNQQILSILQRLVQQPWVLDASVYLLDGTMIAQAGENVSVRERLDLDDTVLKPSNNQQLVEKIDDDDGPVGFLRLTIDSDALKPIEDRTDYTTHLIWFMIVLACVAGFIMAKVLQRRRKDLAVTTQE